MSASAPEVAAAQRKSREHGSDADSGRRAATPVARCAALRVMPVASAARETVQPAGASEGEAARRRSGGGRPQQQKRAAERDIEVLPTEGARPKGGIQVDCSWGHRRRASALRLLIQLFLDEGVLGSYRSNFLSRKSLKASQNEAKEK